MGTPRADRNDTHAVLWDGAHGCIEVLGYGSSVQSAWRDAAHSFYLYHATRPEFAKYGATVQGVKRLQELCKKEGIFLKLASW